MATAQRDTVDFRPIASSLMGGMLNEPLAQIAREKRAEWEAGVPKRRNTIGAHLKPKDSQPI